MDHAVSFKRVGFAALIGAGAGLGALLPPLLPLMPAFLGFVGAAWGTACLGASLFTAALTLFALAGDFFTLLVLLCAVAPVSVILALMLKHKKPYRYAVIFSSAAFMLLGYGVLCLPSVLAGGGPFDLVTREFKAAAEAIAPVVKAFAGSEVQADAMMQALYLVADSAAAITVTAILGLSELFAFLDVLLAKKLASLAKAELKPMAPLVLWQLPKDFIWGALLFGAGAFLSSVAGLNNAVAVVAAAQSLFIPPFALMGLSLFEFTASLSPGRNGRRVLTYAVIVLLFPSSLTVLAGFGALDRILRIRGRMVKRK